jgi:hypothetical protein
LREYALQLRGSFIAILALNETILGIADPLSAVKLSKMLVSVLGVTCMCSAFILFYFPPLFPQMWFICLADDVNNSNFVGEEAMKEIMWLFLDLKLIRGRKTNILSKETKRPKSRMLYTQENG